MAQYMDILKLHDMKKYTRVGSSDLEGRLSELRKAHEDFQKVKDLLDSGAKITDARVKRPRIKKEPQPIKVVISVFGRKLTLTWSEYIDKGNGFTIITKIYD